MKTQCTQEHFAFHDLGSREIVGKFDGGSITSDGGALLLREVEKRTGILEQFSDCFTDHRDPNLIEHTLGDLLTQRTYAMALGYEDLVDHDELRHDPMLATLVGKKDPTGTDRIRKRDRGKALAGKSTLNRLELTPVGANSQSRYKKVVYDSKKIEHFFTEVFLQSHDKPPRQITLDLDATDDPVHGDQLGRFFHGYYNQYCYLPLYIFCGEHLLAARLRPSDIDAPAGTIGELTRIVTQIRARWPKVRIIIRADSGFCREYIMRWCEQHGVDYVLGLPKNKRLTEEIAEELARAKAKCLAKGKSARVYKDFQYSTRDSWSRSRRVVAKAEHLRKGSNPRFLVTSLTPTQCKARRLYEKVYCPRGDAENRIKEQQLYLFADRTSTHTMRANQLRLWFSSVAYVLMHALRRLGLRETDLHNAQCQTIRLKLLKIGAHVRVTVRKVWLSFSSSYPYRELFRTVYENLLRVPSWTNPPSVRFVPTRC